MNNLGIQELIQPETKSRKTERGELLLEFMEAVNINRKKTKYPQVTISYIGHLVAHIEAVEDLYYLASVCRDAGNRNIDKNYYEGFCKRFFYELKPKKKDDTRI